LLLTNSVHLTFKFHVKDCYLRINNAIINSDFEYYKVTQFYNEYIELCTALKQIEEYKKINITTTVKTPNKLLSIFFVHPVQNDDSIIQNILFANYSSSFINKLYITKATDFYNELLTNLDKIMLFL
jgi:hypothetical protein